MLLPGPVRDVDDFRSCARHTRRQLDRQGGQALFGRERVKRVLDTPEQWGSRPGTETGQLRGEISMIHPALQQIRLVGAHKSKQASHGANGGPSSSHAKRMNRYV